MKILKYLFVFALLSPAQSLSAATNILDIRDSIHENASIYPESFETDTRKMQENWYLRNYAVLDNAADSRASVHASDQEIIDRLGEMATVIEMPFNSIVRSYIDMYTDRRKQLVENMLGMSLYYMPIFEQALDRHALPLELKYLPVIESASTLWQYLAPERPAFGSSCFRPRPGLDWR